jgi:hypothetical protein
MKMWTLDDSGTALVPLLGLGDQDVPAHSRPYETLPLVYAQDASLEVFWTSTITELHSISGSRIMAWLTPFPQGVDVNHPYDWTYLEELVGENPDVLPPIDRPPFAKEGST